MTNPWKATKNKAISPRISHLIEPVGLVSNNISINTQNIWPTSPNKQSALVPVRLGDISSVITFVYKINRPSWPTSPNKLSLQALCQLGCQLGCRLGCQLGWGKSTPTYNINKCNINLKCKNTRRKRKKVLKTSRAEQPLTKQMRFLFGRQKKPARKNPCGENMCRKSG